MKTIAIVITLFFLGYSYGYEDHVKYEHGYFYVIIDKEKFGSVNSELLQQIENHGWEVIYTMNVDRTTKTNTPYKTHLLCKRDYLREGLETFKLIGVIIPCRIAIFQEKNYVKIAVEDIKEIVKKYNPNPKFYRFITAIEQEMIDILNRTANEFSKKRLIPQY
ncbi:MAG: DUF302 domain-containing protein [Aquificae bacterium]|nr:DUF302 domain-containing protein [Aquificota bacterium]